MEESRNWHTRVLTKDGLGAKWKVGAVFLSRRLRAARKGQKSEIHFAGNHKAL
jgi:hypothetical protein